MLWMLLVQFVKPHWRLLIGVVVFQLIQAVATLYLPLLNADIIDNGVTRGNTAYILNIGALMLLLTVLQIVAAIIAVYFGAKMAMAVGRDLRAAVFSRVGTFSQREVAGFGAPSLITRSTNDVQQVQMLVLMSATMLVSAPLLSIGGVIMAVRLDVGLSWIIAVSVPVLLIGVSLIVSRMVPLYRKMQVRIDEVNRVLREQLTGIRVIRAFVRESEETDRFTDVNAAVTDSALRTGRLMALMFPTVMIVLNASGVAVIWFGAFRIESGSMQVGTLIAFLSYLMQILIAVMLATFMVAMIPRASVSGDRIAEVLATNTSVVLPAHPITQTDGSGRVEFRDVAFSFPLAEAPVISDISFTAHPGKTTAIIGSTGSGKSTLISLIPRLFDATAGSVVFNGVNVRELAPEVLWADIGLIPQKPFLFRGTVRSNLKYGKPSATEEEMWRALTIAQAADFVQAMPDGLDSEIAQAGNNVSGGQRQRLAIARALVKEPAVYVFDDSFSALDLKTDSLLREALAHNISDATVIMVAQRVSTIRDADQILVVEDGKIVARGTHESLIETSETYREIVESQLSAEEVS